MPRACAAGHNASSWLCGSLRGSSLDIAASRESAHAAAAMAAALANSTAAARQARTPHTLAYAKPTPASRCVVVRLGGRFGAARRGGPHVCQYGLGRPAVDLQAVGLLVGADQGTRVHAGLAVHL